MMRFYKRLRKSKKKAIKRHAGDTPLSLEMLEPRLLLSAQLHIDHLNIVKDSLEAGEIYELQYEIHNYGDAPSYMYGRLATSIYEKYPTGMRGSIGSHYFGSIPAGESTGLQSAWIYMFSMPPADLPVGPSPYIVEISVRGSSCDNDPVIDHVTITANDNSPPEVDMDSVVMTDVTTEDWGETYTGVSFTIKDDIKISGGYNNTGLKIIGPDGSEYSSSICESLYIGNDKSELQLTYKVHAQSSTGSSSWDPGDNGTYAVYLKEGEFKDAYYRETPETYLGSFNVNIESEPLMAKLAYPLNGGSIGIEEFQENAYIDIQYIDSNGWGLKASSITDNDPEFTLYYEDGTEIELKPYTKPTLVEGTESTYRYELKSNSYLSPFMPGVVTVDFIENSFKDEKDTLNEAATQTFTVELPATAPVAELAYPLPDEDIDTGQLNENGYIDVSFKRTKSSSINGDEISFGGAGGENVTVKGKPALIGEDTYRYSIDGRFGAGPVEVAFVADSFSNESGDTNITDTESFVSFPNISPLYVDVEKNDFVWTEANKRFQYAGAFGLGMTPEAGEDFSPLVTVTGDIAFDGTRVYFNGSVAPEIAGIDVPLFSGDFEFDLGSAITSTLNDGASYLENDYTIAGTEIKLTKMEFVIPEGKTVVDTQLELQGSVKLPDDMGGFELSITDPHKLIVSPTAGVSLSGGKLTLPDLEIFMFGGELKMIAKDMSIEYIAEVTSPETVPSALRFRGSVSLPYFYNATADFTGADSYIEVTSLGGVDWYGTLSVEDVVIVPGQWEINNALLGMKKDANGNYITECEAKMTIPTGLALGGKVHFVNGDINFVELEVDDINKPIGVTGAFLQRIMGHVDHLSDYEEPKLPVSFGGSVGITAGPQITVPLPAWVGLGDKAEGVLVGLDLTADVDENHLTGHGYIEIVSGLVQGNANVELDWEHESFSASMSLDALQGMITAEASLFIDHSDAFDTTDIYAAGKGTVSIPEVIPLWGGVELGSANMKLQYRDDTTDQNDYIMGWGKILVSEYHNYYITGGIKVGFDGSYEFVGGKEIIEFTASALSTDFMASAKFLNSKQFNLLDTTLETASYSVGSNAPWLLMGADWGNANSHTTVEVVDPQGHVYSEDDFDSLDQLFVVEALSGDKSKSVYVHEPDAGTWTVRFVSDEPLTDLAISGMTQVELPEVDIVSVDMDSWNQEVAVDYVADFSDEDTVINFYYDTDHQDADGFQFTGDITPTESGQVIWDTSHVSPGTYYVYAEIMDPTNAPVTAYWPEPIIIEEALPRVEVAIGDSLAKSLTYTDPDGTIVTVKLAKGHGLISIAGEPGGAIETIESKKGIEVTGGGLTLAEVFLSNSTAKTSLTVTTQGGDVEGATLGDMTGDTLGKLTGKQLDLLGNIELTGSLGAVMIDDLLDGATVTVDTGSVKGASFKVDQVADDVTLDIAGGIKSFQANRFDSGLLHADSIGSIKINGNFGADITLETADTKGVALKSMAVAGTITHSDIDASAGSVGAITSAQWDSGSLSTRFIKSLAIKGSTKGVIVNGDCDIDLTLSGQGNPKVTLGTAKIAGDLLNSRWDITGMVGSLAVSGTAVNCTLSATGDVKSITLGASDGSDFLVGINETVQRHAASSGDFVTPSATLKSFIIKGIKGSSSRFFVDTNLSAGMFGKISLLNGDFDTGLSGLFAYDNPEGNKEIQSVKHKDTVTNESWSWPPKGSDLSNLQHDTIHLL